MRLADVVGVAHLFHPPVDKVVAQCLVERRLGHELPVVAWWGKMDCPDKQVVEWEATGILPIDIGSEKYHGRAGSATEVVAEKFAMDLTVAERKLLGIVNKNNATGYLKGFHGSMVWTLRELYHIPGFLAEEVIASLKDAIHIFLQEEELPGNSHEACERMEREFPDLMARTEKCNFSPFTPGRLLWDMVRLGCPSDEIRANVAFWLDQWGSMKDTMAKTELGLSELGCPTAQTFTVARNVMGIAVRTDDRLLTKVLARHCAVLAVKNSTGHALISTRDMDVSALSTVIRRHEGDRWHITGSFALNGGPMYLDTPPTVLPLDELVRLVQRYPPTLGESRKKSDNRRPRRK